MATRPANVPAAALEWPIDQVPYVGGLLNSIRTQMDTINRSWAAEYAYDCNAWQSLNLTNRAAGKALTPKPQPRATQVLETAQDPDLTTIWLWSADGPPVGDSCPDLPPLPVPGTIAIGVQLWANEYQCLPGDTVAPNTVINVTDGQFPGVPAGTYLKHPTPWGCVYEKQ